MQATFVGHVVVLMPSDLVAVVAAVLVDMDRHSLPDFPSAILWPPKGGAKPSEDYAWRVVEHFGA